MSTVVWQLNLKEINITLIELWSRVSMCLTNVHFIKTTNRNRARNKASNMEDVAVKNTKNTILFLFLFLNDISYKTSL